MKGFGVQEEIFYRKEMEEEKRTSKKVLFWDWDYECGD